MKFFRKIRQRLFLDQRMSKYLLYGVGEILLVVIGILIALQINNWNEDKKLRIIEQELLYDIRENLIASSGELKKSTTYNKLSISSYEIIMHYVKEDLPYDSSLDSAFSYFAYWRPPNFTHTAYETLKSKGLDIIENDGLKNHITKVYEEDFLIVTDELRAEWEMFQSIVLPFVVKHILYINEQEAQPNDFEALKNNKEFKNIMGIKMSIRKNSIYMTETTKVTVDNLIMVLDEELELNKIKM